MIALFVASAIFQFLAAVLSFRFVYHKRLGPHWSLVTLSLLLMGVLRVGAIVQMAVDGDPGSGGMDVPGVEFGVSFNSFDELVVALDGGGVPEYVQDEALLDGLLH